ncbi:MAG: hypothetical protein LBR10_01260 [Prevotellaceae bacterium]|jgi:hypothetical protein|nr:hypothetical protein [Prevotellaceae bacterium]
MKKSLLFLIFLVILVFQGTSSSTDSYSAVYMDRANLEKSVFYIETVKECKNPGKIYYKHPYLYINEKYKGIHVIDNSNPENPVKKGFIVAPGCLDMAIKGDIIYIDNAVDLVSFDLKEKEETSRIRNVLPEPISPEGYIYGYGNRPENFILVEWVKH